MVLHVILVNFFSFWLKAFLFRSSNMTFFPFQEDAETKCARDLTEDTGVYVNVKEHEMVEVMPTSDRAIMEDSTDKGTYANVAGEKGYQVLGPVPDTKPDFYTDLHAD